MAPPDTSTGLLDNDRDLVVAYERTTRDVKFNARLCAFAKHWRWTITVASTVGQWHQLACAASSKRHLVPSPTDARQRIEVSRTDYNTERPHSALGQNARKVL